MAGNAIMDYNQIAGIYNQAGGQTFGYMPSQPQAPGGAGAEIASSALKNIGGGATTGAATGTPWGAIAGGVLGAVKTGFDVYNTIQNQDRAEKDYEMRQKEYEQALAERDRMRRTQEEQQRVANMYAGANSAETFENRNKQELVNYYRSRGY